MKNIHAFICICQPVSNSFQLNECVATWIPEPDFSIVKSKDHMSLPPLWYALTF